MSIQMVGDMLVLSIHWLWLLVILGLYIVIRVLLRKL